MSIKKNPAGSRFIFSFLLLSVLLTGCHPKKPSEISLEKKLPYEMEMIIPAEETEEFPDVAALVSDLKEQVSTLEKGLKGEDPQFLKTLDPLQQSLKELDVTLNGLDPMLIEVDAMIGDLQTQIDRINNQFIEELSQE